MARRRRRTRYRGWLLLVPALVLAFAFWAFSRMRPQDLPWTALDLSAPVGVFTGRKLAALGDDAPHCRALLATAGIEYETMPVIDPGGECRVENALRPGGGARTILFRPRSPAITCPVAAGLALWEWHVLQPAARQVFGQRVEEIEHLGSYNCRRMYGRDDAPWSEHASANALDIAGFVLADGTRINVKRDWAEGGRKATFLRLARDGACGVFTTVLSPDYNAAHADHFHLDQADRGLFGWRACR
ncbi:extensin family protein [Sphingomonas cavernae]|uniref:Extensin n=1 Tax=Sphingomonas cavernae TaxID=2320861 RepID=A0A418WQH9_9SPHN|nr:extensin family protein [Sphingomonas cavernae]RJF93508.1 extensin [Sphingomonas cavernae]